MEKVITGSDLRNLPSKKEWEAYEAVRESGATNMFMVGTVCDLSGLDRDTVKRCMQYYGECKKLYTV